MDYGNTKTPGMHRRLGSAILSQLAFLGEGNLNIPWEKSHTIKLCTKTMKARLKGEGTGSNYTRQQPALFDELGLVPVCFLQLVS